REPSVRPKRRAASLAAPRGGSLPLGAGLMVMAIMLDDGTGRSRDDEPRRRGRRTRGNIEFVPLAMPLMFGPGAIATILGMTSTIKHSSAELASFVAIVAAIFATMSVTYLCLIYAGKDDKAKAVVRGINDQFGWETADMGTAEASRAIEPLCMLWCIQGFTKNEWTHAFKLLHKA